MSALVRTALALAAALVAASASARAGEVPPSLLTDDMLSWYRQDMTCEGRAYVSIQNALEMEASAAQAAARRRFSDAESLAARIVADYDRAATVAAARGCTELARALWSVILADYQGPAHAAIRARAEAALRTLPIAPVPGRAPR